MRRHDLRRSIRPQKGYRKGEKTERDELRDEVMEGVNGDWGRIRILVKSHREEKRDVVLV